MRKSKTKESNGSNKARNHREATRNNWYIVKEHSVESKMSQLVSYCHRLLTLKIVLVKQSDTIINRKTIFKIMAYFILKKKKIFHVYFFLASGKKRTSQLSSYIFSIGKKRKNFAGTRDKS